MNTILEFKNITYSYNNNTVILDKVNAKFEQSKFYTIIGDRKSVV